MKTVNRKLTARQPHRSCTSHIREALLNLLDSASDLRAAADTMPVGDSEAMRLLKLAQLAETASIALQDRLGIRRLAL